MSDVSAEKSSWQARWRYELLAAGGYFLLSCMYAWRVVVNFTTHIAGHGGDGWQNLWNMWWFKEALLSGQNPYFTDLLHHPAGHTLLFHTLNPFNCALALPFDLLFGQPVAYNVVFLFSFAASGFTMYLLARELFANRAAAFVAGCVYTFSHFHFAHAQGHLQLTAMEWLPLFLFFLVRVWRTGRLRDGAWMGISLALTAFCSLYYFLSGLMIAVLAAILKLIRHPRQVLDRHRLWAVALGAGIFMATGGILLVAMLVKSGQLDMVPARLARNWSTDLQAFFIPPWVSAYGGAFVGIWRKWSGNSAECSQYLGYSVITLSVLAFLWSPKGNRPWAWAGLALFGMVLSMGPSLHWGGTIHDGIPLPYRLLDEVLPFLKLSGAPVRWHVITLLASSVLAAAGLALLLQRIGPGKWKGLSRQSIAAVLVGAFVLAELLPLWVESRPLLYPDFIQEIRQAPDDWVVYDIGDPNEALLRQTGHHHRMIGGYISRTSRPALEYVERNPLFRTLRGLMRQSPEKVAEQARALNLRFFLVPYDHRVKRVLPSLGLRMLQSHWGTDLWEIPWATSPGDEGNHS